MGSSKIQTPQNNSSTSRKRNRAPKPSYEALAAYAERHDVSVTTVKRWARDGKITLHRLPNGHLRVRSDEVARPVRRDEVAVW